MYGFGKWVLDPSQHSLHGEGETLYLRPRAFGVLLFLVERRGRLVTKRELFDALWHGTIVSESALTQAIKEVRHVLRDDAHDPSYVETVPRVGYRFIADVRELSGGGGGEGRGTGHGPETGVAGERGERLPAANHGSPDVSDLSNSLHPAAAAGIDTVGTPPAPRQRLRVLYLAVFLIICLLSAWGGRHLLTRSAPSFDSVAVLPFVNLSGDDSQEYLADGVTEALIADLGKLESLRVISRTSVMRYKGTRTPIAEIRRQLDVDAIVEGSIISSDRGVRITARLVETSTGGLVCVESCEGTRDDLLALQRAVSLGVARRIRRELAPADQAKLESGVPVHAAAYEAQLKGRFYCNKRTHEGFLHAIEQFKRALQIDPRYAAAHVGMADCYALLSNYDLMQPSSAIPRAKVEAAKALEIDDTLAGAHASVGFSAMYYDWDWAGAERAFLRALELSPNDAQTRHWFALHWMMRGRFEKAIVEMEKARSLDPLSLIVNTNMAWLYYFDHQYEQAIRRFREVLEMDPSFVPAHVKLAWALQQQGDPQAAIAHLEQAIALSGSDPTLPILLGEAYAAAGRRDEALAVLEEARHIGATESLGQDHNGRLPRAKNGAVRANIDTDSKYFSAYWIATIHVALGERDDAVEWIRKACQQRSGWLAWIHVDPKFDPIRGDPRFEQIADRIGGP